MADFVHKPGTGSFFKNSYKEEGSNQPDWKGKINHEGELIEFAGWIKDGKKGKYISLSVDTPQDRPSAPKRNAVQEDDDLPF